MSEPRIVTAQEAQAWVDVDALEHPPNFWPNRLAHTVATEPDRTRAAVVRKLRDVAQEMVTPTDARTLVQFARAIENGVDW